MTEKFNDATLDMAMGERASLAKAPNGAIVNQAVLDNDKKVKHQTTESYQITDDVYVIPGPVLNAAFVVMPEGVIVWETGENIEDGARYRREIRKITDKPIKAVIYSHAHYTLGTSALLDGEDDVMVIGHPNLNDNMKSGGLGSYFPETEPLQWARTFQHVNMLLPEEGPEGKFGFVVDLKESGFVPVNTPVEHGQTLTIAGLEIQFFTEGGSDTNDCATAWIRSKGVAFNNLLWPMMPNFYTPRGATFRDPRVWAKALIIMRDLNPEHLVSQHSVSISGSDAVRQTLNDYIDFCNLVLDQTLRGILKGLSPEQLRDFIVMPPHLANNPWLYQSYGMLSWFAPYIMNYALGWWSGDAAELVKLPERAIAERMVPVLGGRDRILELSRDAQSDGEYAWALELLQYAYLLDPQDEEICQLKAELMTTIGHATPSSQARAFLLSQALALRGENVVPKIVPPQVDQIAADPQSFVYYYRVRIDPMKAKDVDKVLAFDFGGETAPVALHIRRGVCEYVKDVGAYSRPADLTLSLNPETWAQLYLNETPLSEMVANGSVRVDGDSGEAESLLALFDPYRPVENTMTAVDAGRLADRH